MRVHLTIEPERRRSLRSPRLWAGVCLAALLVVSTGTWPLLWRCAHPWALPGALLLGHLLFGVSRAIVQLSLRQGWYGLMASVRLLYLPYGGQTLSFYLVLALAEELVFRAIPLSLLSGAWWQVALLAAAFCAIHVLPRWRSCPLLPAFDFLVFGLALGFLFVWLGDLWPLVLIHWVRDGSVAKIVVRRDRLEALRRQESIEGGVDGKRPRFSGEKERPC